MPDIIDNRERRLADTIRHYLGLSRSAHFAVGYFYIGGFEAIASAVPGLEKLRLLIGPATNRKTAEELALGHKVRDLLGTEWRRHTAPTKAKRREMQEETALDVREALALMEQTDEAEELVRGTAEMIAEGVVEVRVYTREPLHAKCYIFDERDPNRAKSDPGWAIVGSSNLTLSGITSNTELNVVLHDPEAHSQVSEWFERLWQDAEDFSPELLREIRSSWAANHEVTPYEIYIKTLYSLFRDQLEAEAEPVEVIDERWPVLAKFQEDAYKWARAVLNKYGGVLVADVVGLGKSYIGAALLKWGRLQGRRPIIICPAGLTEMWQAYSEEFDIGAPVISLGLLQQPRGDGDPSVLDNPNYDDCDLVLIDESHNLRHRNTRRYETLEAWLAQGDRKVIMLTATPIATSPEDLLNQLRLWPGNGRDLPTGQWDIEEFFRQVRDGQADVQELLRHIMIRRPRWYVAEVYGEWRAKDGGPCRAKTRQERMAECRPIIKIGDEEYTFPRRELQDPVTYRIDEAYRGVYEIIRAIIDPSYEGGKPFSPDEALTRADQARERCGRPRLSGEEKETLRAALSERLSYARYGLHEYVKDPYKDKDPYRQLATAGRNLRGLMRILLFKRFESSVEAFRLTCQRIAEVHRRFIEALDNGRVPAGEEMQRALYELGIEEVATAEVLQAIEEAERKAGKPYDIRAFHVEALRRDLERDRVLFGTLYDLVCDISRSEDAKLQRLETLLSENIPPEAKVLIFTQFEETARYLYEALKQHPDVEWVSGSHKQITEIVARFAPKSNPALARRYHGRPEIRVLVATDVLAEGLNLQDAHHVVNYDLHFNPVRLIQRMGRIDRLTRYDPDQPETSPDRVWAYNFFPETDLDAHLGLEEKVRRRIQEMHRIVGLDAAVLHPSEQVDDEGVFAIYTGDRHVLEKPDEGDILPTSLLEAQQLIRQLMREQPEFIERIRSLPDGVRSARQNASGEKYFVYCQAGAYHQLYIADGEGKIVSTDLSQALEAIRCDQDEERGELPKQINRVVGAVKEHFGGAVKSLEARHQQQPRLPLGQQYVLHHLRELRKSTEGEERDQLDILLEAFHRPLPNAVRRRLNLLRREKIEGRPLLSALSRIYHDHQLYRLPDTAQPDRQPEYVSRIICSEAL